MQKETQGNKSRRTMQKETQDQMHYKFDARTRIRSPSGYQDAKRQLRQCIDADQVMQVVHAYEQCEDVQFGTAAMRQIKLLYQDNNISAGEAMMLADKIWDQMNTYVVGMDHVGYSEYVTVCQLTEHFAKVRPVFDQMISNSILPDRVILFKLLKSCRHNADIVSALHYWTTCVNDHGTVPNADCWAQFIAVCSHKRWYGDSSIRALVQECWEDCPHQNHIEVVFRMMVFYKNRGDTEKALEFLKHLDQENVAKNTSVYNALTDIYRIQRNWDAAVATAEEAIANNEYDMLTVTHLLNAKIGLIQSTENVEDRKVILKYVESDLLEFYKGFGKYGIAQINSFEVGYAIDDFHLNVSNISNIKS